MGDDLVVRGRLAADESAALAAGRDEDPIFFSTDPDPAQLKKKKSNPDPT